MTFIVTAEGAELDLRNPAPGHITAYDIAWALSQENRFLRCVRPYSVAEHSLLVCEIAEREFGLDVHGLLAALMHDAHEAYTRDQFGPAKALIDSISPEAPAWRIWETEWHSRVARCFALFSAFGAHAEAIHRADMMALATERRDLMPRSASPWPCLEGIEPAPWIRLNSPERRKMDWEDWRDRWLDKYHEIDFARNELLGIAHHQV
jgi:hypothetical protein